MNVTIINGSLGHNDFTSRILEYLRDQLSQNYSNVDIQFINLTDYDLHNCLNCKQCYRTGKCVYKDDRIEELRAILKNSNGFIFGSPANLGNISAVLLNFQQRVRMTMEQLLYRKPCIIVTVNENLGRSEAIHAMRRMIINAGGYIVSSLAMKDSGGDAAITGENTSKIDNAIVSFIKNLFRVKPPLMSRIYTTIAVHLFMKPNVLRNRQAYQGIINSWIEKKIINKPA